MDTKAIRRRNVRRLIDERFGGKQVDLANAIKRQPDYISRCLHGKKNVGENLARYIESRLRLPIGWLDQEHEKGAAQPDACASPARLITETEDENAMLGYYRGLTGKQKKEFLRLLQAKEQANREVIEELAAGKRAGG